MKKVAGIGINDYIGKVNINRKIMKSYSVWRNMLIRCYDEKFHIKQTSYIGCKVCDEWLNFSVFKKWFDENYPKHLEEKGVDLCLDKDLIGEGTEYSPKNCIFIPRKVNGFLANCRKNNKSGQVGVRWCDRRNFWQVNVNNFDTSKSMFKGYFKDKEEAIKKYNLCRKLEAEKCKKILFCLGYSVEVIEKIR